MISLETLVGGISGCLFYVGYPVYVNSLASSQQKAFYFGFAYSIWNISGVLGNTVGLRLHSIRLLLLRRSGALLFLPLLDRRTFRFPALLSLPA